MATDTKLIELVAKLVTDIPPPELDGVKNVAVEEALGEYLDEALGHQLVRRLRLGACMN